MPEIVPEPAIARNSPVDSPHYKTALKRVELHLRSHPLPPHQAALALKLAGRMNGKGQCWPNESTLAKELCLTARSVRTHLARLLSLDPPLFKARQRWNQSSVFTLIRHPEAFAAATRNDAESWKKSSALRQSPADTESWKESSNTFGRNLPPEDVSLEERSRHTDRHARVSTGRKPKTRKPKPGHEGETSLTPELVAALYAEGTGQPEPVLDAKRRRAVTVAIRDWPNPDTWREMFNRRQQSNWLNGTKNHGRAARFDWLVKRRRSILAGEYDDRPAAHLEFVTPAPATDDAPTAAFHAAMEVALNRHDYVTWILPLVVANDNGARILVHATDATRADWVNKHYRDQLAAAAQTLGKPIDVLPGEVWAPAAQSRAS